MERLVSKIRTRRESGAAVLLTCIFLAIGFTILGLMFVRTGVTVQQSVRNDATKRDVTGREDALIRAVVEQLVSGVSNDPGGVGDGVPWSTIINNANTTVSSSESVPPDEQQTLFGSTSLVDANLADTPLIPTSSVAVPYNCLNGGSPPPSYNPSIYPPLMNSNGYVGDMTNYPRTLLYGAVYATGGSGVSLNGRWGWESYPNIRFNLKTPGKPFVSRRIWWQLPILYSAPDLTVDGQERIVPHKRNFLISLYEIPSQLPISGSRPLNIGRDSSGSSWGNTSNQSNRVFIDGAITASSVNLQGFNTFVDSISSRGGIAVSGANTVEGQSADPNFVTDQEQIDLSQAVGTSALSVAADSGRVAFLPLDLGSNNYTAASAPTTFDLYARPYYHTQLRVIVQSYDPALIGGPPNGQPQGAITITVWSFQDKSGKMVDSPLGHVEGGSGWKQQTFVRKDSTDYSFPWGPNQLFDFIATTTGTGDRNVLVLNIPAIAAYFGSPSSIYSMYVGYQPTVAPDPDNPQDLGVTLSGTNDLTSFPYGLSIVTKHRLYVKEWFNQVKYATPYTAQDPYPATSLFAPEIRFGINPQTSKINLAGRLDIAAGANGSSNPLDLTLGDGTNATWAERTFQLNDIKAIKSMPPITRLNWLFTIDEVN